jgi:hypothetical protein
VAYGVLSYFADMASKSRARGRASPRAQIRPTLYSPVPRGRPPGPPRTHFAKWLRARCWTVRQATEAMARVAPTIGVPDHAIPQPKALLDAVNGRHWPSMATVLLLRHVTNGDVDLQHWVSDIFSDR